MMLQYNDIQQAADNTEGVRGQPLACALPAGCERQAAFDRANKECHEMLKNRCDRWQSASHRVAMSTHDTASLVPIPASFVQNRNCAKRLRFQHRPSIVTSADKPALTGIADWSHLAR
jgi:hypothetical protein